jgi:hypothetical protein
VTVVKVDKGMGSVPVIVDWNGVKLGNTVGVAVEVDMLVGIGVADVIVDRRAAAVLATAVKTAWGSVVGVAVVFCPQAEISSAQSNKTDQNLIFFIFYSSPCIPHHFHRLEG